MAPTTRSDAPAACTCGASTGDARITHATWCPVQRARAEEALMSAHRRGGADVLRLPEGVRVVDYGDRARAADLLRAFARWERETIGQTEIVSDEERVKRFLKEIGNG